MPERTNYRLALSFDDLTPMQQGCLDCIIDCETNGDHAADWAGIGREDFAAETLGLIASDCDHFLSQISGRDLAFEDELFSEYDAADFGWHFHLERQGTGNGFPEMLISQPLLNRLILNAAIMGPVQLFVRDGKVHHTAFDPSSVRARN